MQLNCSASNASFVVKAEDEQFYSKIDVPVPRLSPDERARRRLAFINIRSLYKHNGLISPYTPEDARNVVSYSRWASDEVNGLEFGRGFDFQRTFSEQFIELQKLAPRWNLVTYQCENCDWCINCAYCKDSYLVRSSISAQDCFYSDKIQRCKDVSDCLNISDSELCYELINASHCFEVSWSEDVEGCQHSYYLYDCRSCSYCIGCVGLSHKEFYFLNAPVTREEFATTHTKLLNDAEFRNSVEMQFEKLKQKYLHPAVRILQSENCIGDRLWNCKNVYWGFSLKDAVDCSYTHLGTSAKDCFDCSQPDEMELCYEVTSAYKTYNSKFCFNVFEIRDCDYCETSGMIHDCFGCVGLHRKSFCILNKQYSKEGYSQLRAQIVEHMKKTGEWGEFFSMKHSRYCYNETVAYEYFPLTKAECVAQGYRWREERKDESITNADRVTCPSSQKPFQLQQSELTFYQRMGLPLPVLHPDVRHSLRRGKTNPLTLFRTKCAVTQNEILTSIPPSRQWSVVHVDEYQKRFQ